MRVRTGGWSKRLITSMMLVTILLFGFHHASMAGVLSSGHCSPAAAATATIDQPAFLAQALNHEHETSAPQQAICCAQQCSASFLTSDSHPPAEGSRGLRLVPISGPLAEGVVPSCPTRPPKQPRSA